MVRNLSSGGDVLLYNKTAFDGTNTGVAYVDIPLDFTKFQKIKMVGYYNCDASTQSSFVRSGAGNILTSGNYVNHATIYTISTGDYANNKDFGYGNITDITSNPYGKTANTDTSMSYVFSRVGDVLIVIGCANCITSSTTYKIDLLGSGRLVVNNITDFRFKIMSGATPVLNNMCIKLWGSVNG